MGTATVQEKDAPPHIIDDVTLRIVDALLDNPAVPFNKSQLAEAAGVSRDALYRRWDVFMEYNIVEKADVGAKGTYWTLPPDSDMVDALARIIHPQE